MAVSNKRFNPATVSVEEELDELVATAPTDRRELMKKLRAAQKDYKRSGQPLLSIEAANAIVRERRGGNPNDE